MYESMLQALLSEGVHFDMRKNVKNNVTYKQFQRLPPSDQTSLLKFLPEGDATPEMIEQALRCPQFAEAVREIEDNLAIVTPEVLQKQEDKSWSPRVGERCEGRYRAGVDGATLRRLWYPGKLVRQDEQGNFTVLYDDGDKDDGMPRKFLRPPMVYPVPLVPDAPVAPAALGPPPAAPGLSNAAAPPPRSPAPPPAAAPP